MGSAITGGSVAGGGVGGGSSTLIFQGSPSVATAQFDSPVFSGRKKVDFSFYCKIVGSTEIKGPYINGDLVGTYDGVQRSNTGAGLAAGVLSPALLGLNGGSGIDGWINGTMEITDGSGVYVTGTTIEDDGGGAKSERRFGYKYEETTTEITQVSFTATGGANIHADSRMTLTDPLA